MPATTPKPKPKPARTRPKKATARSPKPAKKASGDYLQDALDDLEKASEKAGKEVSAGIDSARDRINEAREDLSHRGHDHVKDWREQFGSAADEALRELGRYAIRAQRSPEALAELSKEIRERKAQIKA